MLRTCKNCGKQYDKSAQDQRPNLCGPCLRQYNCVKAYEHKARYQVPVKNSDYRLVSAPDLANWGRLTILSPEEVRAGLRLLSFLPGTVFAAAGQTWKITPGYTWERI